MPKGFWAFLLLGFGLSGCASDESVICDRLEECDLLPKGLSVTDCAEQAGNQVPDERLERCADCVEREPCEAISDACRADCQPGD